MTTEEVTQTYQLSQNSIDDFYISETPAYSQASQNSQISTNSLTIDTSFDEDHKTLQLQQDKSRVDNSKLVGGIASSSSGMRIKTSSAVLVPSRSADNLSNSCKPNGVVNMIADMSENPLLERIGSLNVPELLHQNSTKEIASMRGNQFDLKADAKGQGAISPGLDAIWAAVKIVMPPTYDIDVDDDISFDAALARATKNTCNNGKLMVDVKAKGARKPKSRPPKGSADGPSSDRSSQIKSRIGGVFTVEGGVKQGGDPNQNILSCNCRKTKCLKMYCDCFRFKKYCNKHCNCSECANLPEHEEERLAVMTAILERNPDAFKPKVCVSTCMIFKTSLPSYR